MQEDFEASLYCSFWMELVVVLERLRLLIVQKEAGDDGVFVPEGWGSPPDVYKDNTEGIMNAFYFDRQKLENPVALKKENGEHNKFWLEAGALVPSSIYLMPCKELLDHQKLYAWFPPLDDETEFADLTPTILPFDQVQY